MKKFLVVLAVFASYYAAACISETYNGLRINALTDKACAINQYDYCVSIIDTSTVNVDEVSAAIKDSKLTQSILIARTLTMYTDKNKKLKELLNLSCTYPGVAEILINHLYERLTNRYKPGQLKKLMKRKK